MPLRPWRFSISIAVATLLAAACGAPEPGAGVLRWGGDAEGGAPFVEADPADASVVRGFDVEIAGLLARSLGRQPRFVQVGWAAIAQSAARGDFDIGLSGVEDSPGLRASHAVTVPYYEFREVLAVRPADRERFRALADLSGHRVGTLGGTMAHDLLRREQARSGLVPVSYDDDVHPYADLVAGRLDAVLLDHIIAERSLARMGGFVIQPAAVATGHYVGVLGAQNGALRDSVDRVLRAAMLDGSLETIFRRWRVWDETQAGLYRRVVAAGPVQSTPAPVASLTTYFPALLRAAGVTVALSCLSMAVAVLAGTLVAAGRIYGGPVLRALLTGWVEVVRGTPLLLQLFVIYYGLAGMIRLPAFLAAVLGLGLNYAAYESEIYRAALQGVSRSQLEAARTLGFTERQILRLIRAPQALRVALAPMTNDFVALLKDSSLVSVITVVELTKQTAIYATNAGSWLVPGAACAVLYLALSLPLSRLARRLERRWSAA